MHKNSFYKHIKDAIQLNQIRKPLYAVMSNGKTKWLSNFMIFFQCSLLPFAKYFDSKAIQFNKSGIPIMLNDFVSMSQTNPYDANVLRKNKADKSILKKIKSRIYDYKNKVKKKVSFLDICEKTHKELIFIENLEIAHSTNFPMMKHLLESIGFISFNSNNYTKKSNNATSKLSNQLINLHLFALGKALFIDKLCQNFHKDNIGIVINDIPTIPFKGVFKQ